MTRATSRLASNTGTPVKARSSLRVLRRKPMQSMTTRPAPASRSAPAARARAPALERGDARLDVAHDLLLADEPRRAAGEARHQDLVVAGRRQRRDGRAREAVERAGLAYLDAGAHDRRHLRHDVGPGRLAD